MRIPKYNRKQQTNERKHNQIYTARAQHNTTTQHNTTQHNTTQHNTTQHNTTQHNTTRQRNNKLMVIKYSLKVNIQYQQSKWNI